jgi:hypothetical protein
VPSRLRTTAPLPQGQRPLRAPPRSPRPWPGRPIVWPRSPARHLPGTAHTSAPHSSRIRRYAPFDGPTTAALADLGGWVLQSMPRRDQGGHG